MVFRREKRLELQVSLPAMALFFLFEGCALMSVPTKWTSPKVLHEGSYAYRPIHV